MRIRNIYISLLFNIKYKKKIIKMELDKQIHFLKQQCENIDSEILILLKRRFQSEKRMVDAKLKAGFSEDEALDLNREVEVINFVTTHARKMDIPDSCIHELYEVIMKYSNSIEQKKH